MNKLPAAIAGTSALAGVLLAWPWAIAHDSVVAGAAAVTLFITAIGLFVKTVE